MTVTTVDFSAGSAGQEISTIDANWIRHPNYAGTIVRCTSARCRYNATSSYGRYYRPDLGTADYETATEFYVQAADGINYALALARISTSANTMYYAMLDDANTTGELRLFKVVAGTVTQLGASVSYGLSVGQTYKVRLRCAGSTISAYVGDEATPRISVTDASIAIGRPGIGVACNQTPSDSVGYQPSLFKVDDLAGDSASAASNVIWW